MNFINERNVINALIFDRTILSLLRVIIVISSISFQSFQRFQWVALRPFATILSFIRIIRAVAHFYGNFFVHFFCLELFRVNFFRARSWQLQHAIRYVTPHVLILSFFLPPFFIKNNT